MKRFFNTPFKATLFLLFFITLLDLLVINQLGLSVDEANYALYGTHLAWSYYDHPPLVGWLQALIIPFSHSNFALRIWPMLFNIGTALILFRFSKLLFTNYRWLPFVAVCCMQSALILHVLSMALIPQVPFLFFSLLALLYLYKLTSTEKVNDFLLFGLFLGLAALAEYTAFLLIIIAAIYLLTTKPKIILNYKIYLSGLLALVCSLPVFYWNYQHHFLGFHYQHNHVLGADTWSVITFLQAQAVQAFSYSPGIYLLGIIAAIMQWKNNNTRLLVITFFVVILFFAYGSGHTVTLPHWPALAWLAACPLIANFVLTYWHNLWIKIVSIFSLGYSLLLILFIHYYALFSWPAIPLGQSPLQDLYGWNYAAQVGKQLLQQNFPNGDGHLFVTNWTLSTRIAWYAQMPVQITEYQAVSQTSLWYGSAQAGTNGIVIVPSTWQQPSTQGTQPGQFKQCQLLTTAPLRKNGALINQVNYYRCINYLVTPAS